MLTFCFPIRISIAISLRVEVGDLLCTLLCVNDEKSGVVLGYFLYISQPNFRPGDLFFLHLTIRLPFTTLM